MNQITQTAASGSPTPYSGRDSIGLVILEDPLGLAPQVARILRTAAAGIGNVRRQSSNMHASHRTWPFVAVRSDRVPADGAGRPGSLKTVISKGPLMRPTLRIQTFAVHELNLMHCNTGRYLLGIAQIVEGGDGSPSDHHLRALAVASKLCDQDPQYDGDHVVLHSGTAFEPPFLYDDSYRGVGRMDPRILPVARHLSSMVNALPHITWAEIGKNNRGMPWITITACADQADSNLSQDDLDLVGWPSRSV